MEELIKSLEEDVLTAKKELRGLKATDSEYSYWNGVWCQATLTLKRIKKDLEN